MDIRKMIEDMADYIQKEKRKYVVRRIVDCVFKLGMSWAIPKDAAKPLDARRGDSNAK